jgi:conjugal transfer pilus assembly protein TraE
MIVSKFVKDRAKALKIADNLSLSNIVLIIFIFFVSYHALNKKTVLVVVPPYLDERVTLAYNAVSENYHSKYSLYAAILMGNVTPATVSETVDALKYTFSPKLYSQMKMQLQKESDALKNSASTLQFIPKSWEYEPDTGKTFVTGKQVMRPLNGQPTQKLITYEFKLEVNNYVPWIKSFAIYGGVAHNKHWISENKSSESE